MPDADEPTPAPKLPPTPPVTICPPRYAEGAESGVTARPKKKWRSGDG